MHSAAKSKELKNIQDAVTQLQRSIVLQTNLVSFCLGIIGTLALTLAGYAFFVASDPVLYAFGMSVSFTYVMFHMFEFLVAAYLRPRETHREAFMLCRGGAYVFIHLFAFAEFFVESYYVPESWKWSRDSFWGRMFRLSFQTTTIFTCLTVAANIFRVLAMLQCGTNFSLRIDVEKREGHKLVDTGFYAWVRHPSYTGFFARAVFYQLLLANPISCVVHVLVTWLFLKKRLEYEEEQLLREGYFGKQYAEYRQKTPSGIPFVP